MIRTVFAIMAGLLCGLAGLRHASTLIGNASRLRRWVQILKHLLLLLKQGQMPIPQVLQACADGHSEADRLLQAMAAHLQAEPLTTLAQAFTKIAGDHAEQPLLLQMFTHLGHGLHENRCRAVEHALEEMKLLAESAAQKAEKDVKLWQTLGLLGGLCLTILLL